MNVNISKEEQALLNKFLADRALFLGPDPDIMRNHSVLPRSPTEDAILEKGLDPHTMHHVRGLINSAPSEAFTMINQMGAARRDAPARARVIAIEGGRRYPESYFEVFPGVWRHGDFIRINSRGGCYIYGRSDSTLNRHGVRIGTAEIYRAVEQVPEVADSLIVCCELPGGTFFMPLFLKLKAGAQLDDALARKIGAKLREDCSPRRVRDRTYQVEDVPYTLTHKKMEVPVRKILMGWPQDKAGSRDAMMNLEAIDFFVRFAEEFIDYQWRRLESGQVLGRA